MVNSELTRRHGVSRSAADIKAELGLVARLISGLPTNVGPGEYEVALQTHLTSLSTVLQLELEQTVESSGSRHCPSCGPPVAHRPLARSHLYFELQLQALMPLHTRQLPSLRALPRNSAPTLSRTHPMPML
jgi:hypothetical protein